MSSPAAARTLARGRRTQNWLAIALVASGLTNIVVPIYFWATSHVKDQVVVFDLASGTLLLSPLVDPASSKEVLEICASWAAKCVLDRSPTGLENEELVSILFNSETGRKARDEFSAVKQQYSAKNLRSHVEIKSIDAQPIGNGIIKARVIGQVIITGVVNDQAIQEVQPVTLDFSLARNPDLGRVHRYPLMVFQYNYATQGLRTKAGDCRSPGREADHESERNYSNNHSPDHAGKARRPVSEAIASGMMKISRVQQERGQYVER